MDGEDAIVTDADGAAAKPRTSLPTLPSAPNQPVNVSCIPQQRLTKRTLSLQNHGSKSFLGYISIRILAGLSPSGVLRRLAPTWQLWHAVRTTRSP